MTSALMMFGHKKGGAAAILTYIDSHVLLTNLSTYNFGVVPIGIAAEDRLVVVVSHANDTNGFDHMDIGGVEADEIVSRNSSGGNSDCTMCARLVPAGVDANITVVYDDAATSCSIDVYTITNITSVIPVDSDGSIGTGSGASSVTLTNIESGAAIIAGISAFTENVTFSWSGGVTEDKEEAFDGDSGSASVASGIATGTSITPTVTPSESAERAFVAAAWQ